MIDIILTNATPMAPNGLNLGESLKLITSVPDKPISVTAVVDESPVEPSYEKQKRRNFYSLGLLTINRISTLINGSLKKSFCQPPQINAMCQKVFLVNRVLACCE